MRAKFTTFAAHAAWKNFGLGLRPSSHPKLHRRLLQVRLPEAKVGTLVQCILRSAHKSRIPVQSVAWVLSGSLRLLVPRSNIRAPCIRRLCAPRPARALFVEWPLSLERSLLTRERIPSSRTCDGDSGLARP